MYDYLELTKVLYDDNIFLKDVQHEASYQSGWEKFLLHGYKDLEIWYKPTSNLIRIKGACHISIKAITFHFRSRIHRGYQRN